MSDPIKLSESFLKMIRCPISKSSLALASESQLNALNQKIAKGDVTDRLGRALKNPIESGLVNEDGSLFFPIQGGIIKLVTDDAIDL